MRPIFTRTKRVLAEAFSSSGTDRGFLLSSRNTVRSRQFRCVPMTEALEERALMSTYYVSTSGNDSNKGTSASAPWKSIGKVNSITLHAGDSVLFKGGQTFYGSLEVGSKDAGTSSLPVTFGSYDGQATINSGKATAATVLDASGIWFENLKIVGTPSNASQSGIDFQGYTSGVYHTNDRIDDCNISGFWTAGVLIEGSHTNGGFIGLRVTDNSIYNNVESGIQTCSFSGDTSLLNLYVGHNEVYNNYGDGYSVCTGNGIMLGNVTGALVEYNDAYLNGSRGGNGGVGIWAYTANDVTFQYNSSYDNITTRGHDGDAFDFDADVSNSVMQYNYAYNNDGTGIQLDQWKNDSDFTNDIVRYNVLTDNARENDYGNLEVWGRVLNSYLYNNVIVTTTAASGSNSAIRVHNSTISGLYVSGVHFVDNILDTSGGATLINIPEQEARGAENLTFIGNIYWTNGSTPTIIDGANVLHSLTQWQSAGQETWDGKKYGMFANPDFVNAGSGGVATPQAGLADLTTTEAGYKLGWDSPALTQSLSITSMYGVGTGGKDFFGDSVASNAATVAGVDQSGGSKVTVTAEVSGTPTLTGNDIGKVAEKGSNSVSNGTYTITSGGSDVWGTSDAFRYDDTTLTGDGTIIAQVSSMNESSDWAKAGVMIRSSDDADAQEVSMLVSPIGMAEMQTRKSTDAATTTNAEVHASAQWVKLVRSGNEFSGYESTDGVHWTLVSTTTVSMTNTVEIGLSVSDHVTVGSETASFKNVSIT